MKTIFILNLIYMGQVFDAAPTDVAINSLTVVPQLKFRIESTNSGDYEVPYIHFECVETPAVDRSANQNLLYSTYWFVESTLLKAYERQKNVKAINENDLMDSGYKLGVTIQCGIRVSTSVTGFPTEMKSSASFFAGVKVEPLAIFMNKENTATITLRPTVPFGCYAKVGEHRTGRCFHSVNMHYPELSNTQCEVDVTNIGSLTMANNLQERCGVEIEGFYPHQANSTEMKSVSLNITSPYFSDSDPTEYRLSLKTLIIGTHEIWKNVFLSDVQLKIITNDEHILYKKNNCYAHADTHMLTADGRDYDINAGSFIMYEHNTGIQVQIRTTACNYNRAYCVCAVAVRAGGDVFLINLCGALKYIDMTSCKDVGVLVIQKYSEYSYQVVTYIGTIVKINFLSGKYKNLMNVDIYMAPKDYNRINGLCGTFDGNTKNDFHDRSGTNVDRNSFLQAWKISNSDINLLQPSCSVNVSTWIGMGQPLYCTCNSKSETLDDTASCSPSQYVNCTVSLTKTSEFSLTITSDLCQDFETRCSVGNTARRSSFYINPDDEMHRKSALANQPLKFVKKTGQDPGWTETHKLAADSAIEIGYKRDANYTLSDTEPLKKFRTQLCPYNCNGNGVCQENGTCTCHSLFFGPDCETNKSTGPGIEDIEGGGFCDQRHGSECRCFSVQTEALTESFKCKMVKKKKMLNGNTQNVGTDSIDGRYRNYYNGECCFAEGRRKHSSDTETDVLHYVYDISISNDGLNFGPVTIVYVFDSLCLNRNTDIDENVLFTVKADTCLIDGYCYKQNDVKISNVCFKCDPSNTQYNWTQGCKPSPKNDETNPNWANISGVVVGVLVGIVFIVIVVFLVVKSATKDQLMHLR